MNTEYEPDDEERFGADDVFDLDDEDFDDEFFNEDEFTDDDLFGEEL